jgi:hypothetical protein
MNIRRRDFLGWTAIGAAAILAPKLIRPEPKVFDMGRGLSPRNRWLYSCEDMPRAGQVFLAMGYADEDEYGVVRFPGFPVGAKVRITSPEGTTTSYQGNQRIIGHSRYQGMMPRRVMRERLLASYTI